MAHFDSLIEQKLLLREKLLGNQNVVNLLVNTGNNMAEFTDVETGSEGPASDFIKTHFYVPGTTVKDKNFITMRSRVHSGNGYWRNSDPVKYTSIVIDIICNEDQIDLLQGSRADLLANEVDMILNRGDALFGYGGIEIGQAEEVEFIEGYYGWEIPFSTHEINRKAELL